MYMNRYCSLSSPLVFVTFYFARNLCLTTDGFTTTTIQVISVMHKRILGKNISVAKADSCCVFWFHTFLSAIFAIQVSFNSSSQVLKLYYTSVSSHWMNVWLEKSLELTWVILHQSSVYELLLIFFVGSFIWNKPWNSSWAISLASLVLGQFFKGNVSYWTNRYFIWDCTSNIFLWKLLFAKQD